MVKMCGCGQKGNLVFSVAGHSQDGFKAAGKLCANFSRNMKHAKSKIAKREGFHFASPQLSKT